MTRVVSSPTGDTKLVCNKCGSEEEQYQEFIHIKHSFGYGTILDSSTIDIHICENCMVEFIDSFNTIGIDGTFLNKEEYNKIFK